MEVAFSKKNRSSNASEPLDDASWSSLLPPLLLRSQEEPRSSMPEAAVTLAIA